MYVCGLQSSTLHPHSTPRPQAALCCSLSTGIWCWAARRSRNRKPTCVHRTAQQASKQNSTSYSAHVVSSLLVLDAWVAEAHNEPEVCRCFWAGSLLKGPLQEAAQAGHRAARRSEGPANALSVACMPGSVRRCLKRPYSSACPLTCAELAACAGQRLQGDPHQPAGRLMSCWTPAWLPLERSLLWQMLVQLVHGAC